MVMLFEVEHGCPLALVDASSITAIRTAAVSGVATQLLAREDAQTLAILGSGVQAGTHLEAMLRARNISRVVVWSRTESNALRFAERETARHGMPIETAASAEQAVAKADIICTTTSAREPVLAGAWISPGAHINAVGACLPTFRELDTAALAGSRLFVDSRESLLNEAGDFLIPKKEGVIDDSHVVGEIGEILLRKIGGRESDDETTLFKSLGIGVEDLGAAHYIYEKAVKSGAGMEVELGGPG
jgi:ornithine cyclodeaminase